MYELIFYEFMYLNSLENLWFHIKSTQKQSKLSTQTLVSLIVTVKVSTVLGEHKYCCVLHIVHKTNELNKS